MYPHKIFSLVSVSILLLSSCQNETPSSHIDVLDTQVYEAIQTQSKTGNLDYFILPESDDFARIPKILETLSHKKK